MKTSGKHPETSGKKPKEIILEYIMSNEGTLKKHIVKDLNLTEGQVKHALKILKENNIIESSGKGKNTCYIIKNK